MTDNQLPGNARILSGPARWLLQGLAGVCLLLAMVGVVLPVLPTVPFLIVAAWASARSSPRLHAWLLTHPRFGAYLRDWNEAGVIPRRAKWLSTGMMGASAASMPVFIPRDLIELALAMMAAMAGVLFWLWRQPEQRAQAPAD